MTVWLKNMGGPATAAVGVAAGDVVLKDFLETHNLLPAAQANTDLYLAPADEASDEAAAGAAAFPP